MSAAPAPSKPMKQKDAMSNTDGNKVNEFEDEWIQGETAPAAKDAEAVATVEAAQAEAAQAADDYVQAHTDLESQNQ